MMRASSWTLPSRLRKLPRPASKVSSSSMMTTASSTASRAAPPRSNTRHPAAKAFRTPLRWSSVTLPGMAHAPPCTTGHGWNFRLPKSGEGGWGQDEVKEADGPGVVNKQAEVEGDIAITIDNRIEEGAELSHLAGGASDAPIHHVKNASANDDESGVKKHPRLILRGCIPEEERCGDIDQQANKCQEIWRDASQSQAVHNRMQQHPAAAA